MLRRCTGSVVLRYGNIIKTSCLLMVIAPLYHCNFFLLQSVKSVDQLVYLLVYNINLLLKDLFIIRCFRFCQSLIPSLAFLGLCVQVYLYTTSATSLLASCFT